MSLYARWILPRLVDFSMRKREAMRYRSEVVPGARGVVLEVGVGSGLNLPFYGAGVERVYGLDPSRELLAMARKRADTVTCPIEFLTCPSEEISLDDGCIDTVVATWTLCSIADPLKALKEMRRVLKPGGSLLFAEHGLAPDARVQGWQQRLNPLWSRITGGCNLNRRIDAMIEGSGFRLTELRMEYADGPRPTSYVYSGQAQPADSL